MSKAIEFTRVPLTDEQKKRLTCNASGIPDGAPVQGWQPIETASKFGEICVAHEFLPGRWTFNHAWWNPETEEWQDEFGDFVLEPTYWMPLPKVPEDPSVRGWVGLSAEQVRYFQMTRNVYPSITKEIEDTLRELNE